MISRRHPQSDAVGSILTPMPAVRQADASAGLDDLYGQVPGSSPPGTSTPRRRTLLGPRSAEYV
ncbi:hypothetical protein GBAR_LOCUS2370, partial [Geodia barretti]